MIDQCWHRNFYARLQDLFSWPADTFGMYPIFFRFHFSIVDIQIANRLCVAKASSDNYFGFSQ
jgi:hypothetical protein